MICVFVFGVGFLPHFALVCTVSVKKGKVLLSGLIGYNEAQSAVAKHKQHTPCKVFPSVFAKAPATP